MTNIKLATAVGFFFPPRAIDSANVYIACPTCFVCLHIFSDDPPPPTPHPHPHPHPHPQVVVQKIALQAAPADRASNFLVSAFPKMSI